MRKTWGALGALPEGNAANQIGIGFDTYDAFLQGSPLEAMNLMMRLVDYQLNKMKK